MRLVRRLAATAVLCLLAGVGGAAGPEAARADAPQVTIVTPGGASHTLALEALAGSEDVVGRPYALRSGEGEATRTVTGFSIAALLAAADVDPYGFSYLEVQRPGGGAVQLSSNQALMEGAFPDGPPVVYAAGTGTGFLRPAVGADDDNAADSFAAPQGLTIDLRKGASLQVRAEATPRRTVPGKQVHFHAEVVRSGSAEQLTWSWYFDDGHSGEGRSAVHSFAKPGSYAVVVGVKAAGDETGTSAVVRIQVGKAPGGGPDRQGGGHDKAADAPDHGAADGPSSGSFAPTATPAPGPGSTSAAAPETAPATTPTPAPEPTAPAVKPAPKATKAPAPRKRPKAARAPAPSGEPVSGELLETEAAAPRPAAARAAQRAAARTGTPRAAGGDGVPGTALGLGAVALVLGLGALAEAGAFVDLIPRIAGRLR